VGVLTLAVLVALMAVGGRGRTDAVTIELLPQLSLVDLGAVELDPDQPWGYFRLDDPRYAPKCFGDRARLTRVTHAGDGPQHVAELVGQVRSGSLSQAPDLRHAGCRRVVVHAQPRRSAVSSIDDVHLGQPGHPGQRCSQPIDALVTPVERIR